MRILDLYCGAGGAGAGYARAGFEVIGVDLAAQPNYPYEFVRCNALEFLGLAGVSSAFDAIHASPPCQAHSTLRALHPSRDYPDLVAATRELLQATGLPYVIENVIGAPLRDPLQLCGSSFGLGCQCRDGRYRQLRRHRLFETSWLVMFPPPCVCSGAEPVGVYGHGGGQQNTTRRGGLNRGYKGDARESREAMGIDWMNRYEISQAIPPAYTEYLGRALAEQIELSGRLATA